MMSEINFELKIQLVYLSRPNKMTPSGRDLNKE